MLSRYAKPLGILTHRSVFFAPENIRRILHTRQTQNNLYLEQPIVEKYTDNFKQHGYANYKDILNPEEFINSNTRRESEKSAIESIEHSACESGSLGYFCFGAGAASFLSLAYNLNASPALGFLAIVGSVVLFTDSHQLRREIPGEITDCRTEDISELESRIESICAPTGLKKSEFVPRYDLFVNAKLRALQDSLEINELSPQQEKYIDDLLTVNLSHGNFAEFHKKYVEPCKGNLFKADNEF